MFALQLLAVLLLVSGLIAFIGDNVGRSIGRKRLSVLNLRPRHTAIAITVMTGVVIALFTVSILFATSADVRTAIFGLDKLRSLINERTHELEKIKSDKQSLLDEISKLTMTLDDSRKEIDILNKTKDNLSKEIQTARSGKLLFSVNDMLSSTSIPPTKNIASIKSILIKLLADTDSVIKRITGGPNRHYLVMPQKELEEAAGFLATKDTTNIVRVVSARNVIAGEEIPVHFEIFENKSIYNRGEIIASAIINGSKTLPEIEQSVKNLLSQVNEIAINKGIMPNALGSVGDVPYSRIFDLTKTIKNTNKTVTVNISCQKQAFSSGPLEINFKVID